MELVTVRQEPKKKPVFRRYRNLGNRLYALRDSGDRRRPRSMRRAMLVSASESFAFLVARPIWLAGHNRSTR